MKPADLIQQAGKLTRPWPKAAHPVSNGGRWLPDDGGGWVCETDQVVTGVWAGRFRPLPKRLFVPAGKTVDVVNTAGKWSVLIRGGR